MCSLPCSFWSPLTPLTRPLKLEWHFFCQTLFPCAGVRLVSELLPCDLLYGSCFFSSFLRRFLLLFLSPSFFPFLLCHMCLLCHLFVFQLSPSLLSRYFFLFMLRSEMARFIRCMIPLTSVLQKCLFKTKKTYPKKWRQTHPKNEDDLTQKDEDDFTQKIKITSPKKSRRPQPKN